MSSSSMVMKVVTVDKERDKSFIIVTTLGYDSHGQFYQMVTVVKYLSHSSSKASL